MNELYVASKLESNLGPRWEEEKIIRDGPFLHNPIPTQSMTCLAQHVMHSINPPPHDFLLELNKPG
eukprot:3468023-Ditylum_brightwellii.AAC.1